MQQNSNRYCYLNNISLDHPRTKTRILINFGSDMKMGLPICFELRSECLDDDFIKRGTAPEAFKVIGVLIQTLFHHSSSQGPKMPYNPERVTEDILPPIFEQLPDPRDLYNCSLVSWTFNRAVTPVLYRSWDTRVVVDAPPPGRFHKSPKARAVVYR